MSEELVGLVKSLEDDLNKLVPLEQRVVLHITKDILDTAYYIGEERWELASKPIRKVLEILDRIRELDKKETEKAMKAMIKLIKEKSRSGVAI